MGLFDFLSSKKDSGRDSGNPFNMNADEQMQVQDQIGKFLNFQSDPNVTGTGASDYATNQVQNNAMLGQLFGKGGTLDQTNQEAQDLAKNGWSLTPQDYTAYGQASDDLARQFGSAGGSLAQALSNQGLSSSGVAGSSFSGLQGNKLEQLGQMQRQIANDRMNMNMQRLGQTRQFLSNLAGQASQDINQQYGRNLSGEQQKFGEEEAKNNAAYQRLAGQAGQGNQNLMQRQQTQTTPMWAQALQGAGNFGADAAMTYAMGGYGGGGIFDKPGQSSGAMSGGKSNQNNNSSYQGP